MSRLTVEKSVLDKSDFRTVPLTPKDKDDIYKSSEFKRWRAAVLQRAGNRCQAIDHVGEHRPGEVLYADHKIELRDGGSEFDVGNGQALCYRCHVVKTDRERTRRAGEQYKFIP